MAFLSENESTEAPDSENLVDSERSQFAPTAMVGAPTTLKKPAENLKNRVAKSSRFSHERVGKSIVHIVEGGLLETTYERKKQMHSRNWKLISALTILTGLTAGIMGFSQSSTDTVEDLVAALNSDLRLDLTDSDVKVVSQALVSGKETALSVGEIVGGINAAKDLYDAARELAKALRNGDHPLVGNWVKSTDKSLAFNAVPLSKRSDSGVSNNFHAWPFKSLTHPENRDKKVAGRDSES